MRHYMTVSEVAKKFAISKQTVLREIRDGNLEAIKIREQYRVPEAAVATYESQRIVVNTNEQERRTNERDQDF